MQTLTAYTRKEVGKGLKPLRKKGILPAVLYGEGVASQPIALPLLEFEKAFKEAGESTLLTLSVEGKTYNVLIHDIAYDALRGHAIHADFHTVRMDKAIRAHVPIEFFGEAPAVKNEGGILVKVMHEIEVEALPQDLPHELRLDMSLLATLETHAVVKDVVLPKGVKIISDPEKIVALIEAPRSTEDLATPVEAGIAEVKTEQEEKREIKAQQKETEE